MCVSFFQRALLVCRSRFLLLAFKLPRDIMSPLRGSRTMLLVISCNSPLRLYFLALLFFPINFSISSHFSFSIFPSRYIFSIRRSSFSDSCFNFPLVKKLSSHSSRFFLLYLRLENWLLVVVSRDAPVVHLSTCILFIVPPRPTLFP